MRTEVLILTVTVFLFYEIRDITASKQSEKKVKHLLENICDDLHDEDLSSIENRHWENFCEKWLKSRNHHHHHQQENQNILDEVHVEKIHQPRRSRSRGGSRVSSRSSRSSSRRSSSIATRYRNTRTGAVISRPSGWLWSRTRHVFLPVSRFYHYRSRSSSNRYTTPATSSGSYYYCTMDTSNSTEIQCYTTTGDNQCCEEETNRQVYCCGGDIDSEFSEDSNQGRKLLTQIFYTLSAIALMVHLFMRRFNR
ncbi:hypothetical protein I4U23_024594 [Adineta vaga]|nr:hypothetical protein I4U23_024594 [Adineta vaga]